MKKLALLSGLLFLVVYLVVNNFTDEESTFEAGYLPPAPASSSDSLTGDVLPLQVKSITSSGISFDSYIIVASLTTPEQAGKAAEDLAAKYKKDFFVLPPTSSGYYRISYGRYSSPEEAQAVLESVKNGGFPNAWLFVAK